MLRPAFISDALATYDDHSMGSSSTVNMFDQSPETPLFPGRILVVDDNESIRIFLRHFFKLERIPVEIIDSPTQALELFRAEPELYSMLLTDCEMPGMSGLELAQEVRRLRADLPMVIFSTSVTVLGANRFLRQGFAAALPKPVALEQLRTTVRGILDPNYSTGCTTNPQPAAPAAN